MWERIHSTEIFKAEGGFPGKVVIDKKEKGKFRFRVSMKVKKPPKRGKDPEWTTLPGLSIWGTEKDAIRDMKMRALREVFSKHE